MFAIPQKMKVLIAINVTIEMILYVTNIAEQIMDGTDTEEPQFMVDGKTV